MLRTDASGVAVGLRAEARAPTSLKTAVAFAGVVVTLVPVAYLAIFNGFHAYDDEGIFLVTLRDYLSGHPVLTPYVPLYGPFFYEVMGGLFKLLGLQPTHETGRWVTLVVWLIASVMGGLAALRLTRKLWIALAAQMASFIVLVPLTIEPMSTYGLSSVLLLSLAGVAAVRSSWPRATAALIGAIVGALFLIKVNVGGFAAIAVAFAWAASLPQRQRRLLLPLVALLMAAFPLVLTAGAFSRDSVLEFASVVGLAAAAIGVSTIATRAGPAPPHAATWLSAGGVVLVLGCIGVALAGGSRLEDGWTALLLFAFKFPGVFTLPVRVNPVVDVFAALSLVAVVILCRRRLTGVPSVPGGMVRIAAGFLMWVSILLPGPIFLLALPLAWLATQQPTDDHQSPTDPYARLLLPALAVVESLQAYPVAGTQLALAAVGLIPVAAITLNDGIRQIRRLDAPRTRWVKVAAWMAPATLLTTIGMLELNGLLALVWFSGGVPLGLPGAESIRLPAEQAVQLRAVVSAVEGNNCSILITSPGMDSFYVWTTDEGPIQTRYGQWWLTLDRGQQQSIVSQLEADPRVCLVKNQKQIDFWTQGRPAPSGPLVDFIGGDFVESGTYGDYELFVRVSQ